ncbi:SHOCT domain-containing protein [Streptomyces sp. NPDC020403]|uniref:SHOCT domain-containing protein n=1 Tax=unclassified Streptomyces TaxID=2593676 RepID=UPI0033CD0623
MAAQTYLAYDYPILSVFWSMLLFFLWILWFILLFRVVTDIFRDDALSGWAKTGWLALTVLLPFLGVFAYVVARGRDMGRREIRHARAQQEAFDARIRQATEGGDRSSSVDDLAKLSEIRARGDITDEEFSRAKTLILAGHGHAGPPETGGTTAAGR